jgi:phosphonate transport system substrate-binding protein
MRAVNTFVLGLAALLLSATVAAQCTQQSLRVAVIPKKTVALSLQEHQPLVNLLSAATGMPVELVPASSYESVVDAIVSGGVDIAWLGPASYVLAHQRDPRIEPFASLIIGTAYFTPAGRHYQALLLARSGVAEDIDGLRGKRVALTDPASTSGSVVPNTEFAALTGTPLGTFFSSVVYSGSHDKSLDALLDGKVDAAFVSSVRVDDYLSNGRISRDTFNVLWRSAPIYYDPFVFQGSLCPALKERIRSAMLNGQAGLKEFLHSQDAAGIAPVSDADYAPLLRMMQ